MTTLHTGGISGSRRLLAVPACMALALVAGLGATHATAAASGRYAAQAEHAGLTGAQSVALQKDVDRYVAQTGGKQVSANRIDVPGGFVLVAVPGEKYARDLRTTTRPKSAADCDYLNFCGWPQANYEGTVWEHSSCNFYWEIPNGWNSGGSWWNNQSSGTVARMYNKSKHLVFQTKPAQVNGGSYDAHGNWHPVWYVKVC
ncbi:peptidase inhibitor family I36 protein [Streptomyces sp. NPDC051162]|uniref:peptidase inhibitor family I36 protein n=1 Tax=unclassified Streptomyces TaxID=2593676 RepID=UPI00341AD550